MRRVRSVKRGFTLVELLVVIGIIALLISILLPALNRAREQGNRAKCLSNMRQLTMAWIMYANDNKGHLVSADTQGLPAGPLGPGQGSGPGLGSVPGGGLGGYANTAPGTFFWSWTGGGNTLVDLANGKLWPYLKSYEVFVCPDEHFNYIRDYSIDGDLAGESTAAIGGKTLLTMGQIRHAYATFVFIEDYDPRGYLINSFTTNAYPSTSFGDDPANFHQGGTTISFADGHALFWAYNDPRTMQLGTGQNLTGGVTNDVPQIEAWNAGPVPPGVIQ